MKVGGDFFAFIENHGRQSFLARVVATVEASGPRQLLPHFLRGTRKRRLIGAVQTFRAYRRPPGRKGLSASILSSANRSEDRNHGSRFSHSANPAEAAKAACPRTADDVIKNFAARRAKSAQPSNPSGKHLRDAGGQSSRFVGISCLAHYLPVDENVAGCTDVMLSATSLEQIKRRISTGAHYDKTESNVCNLERRRWLVLEHGQSFGAKQRRRRRRRARIWSG
jgi:hypothetical protein